MKFVDFTGAEMIHIEASGKKTRFDDAILDGVNARYGVFSGMIGPRVSLDSADMSFSNLVHAKYVLVESWSCLCPSYFLKK